MPPNFIYDDVVVGQTPANDIFARRGTFNNARQHFYPTETNGLTRNLEAPYAHSLSNGVRYWTREDALFDIRWNAIAKPPCLNCLSTGSISIAKRCDQSKQQENSAGAVRCCTFCREAGDEDSCVELIEIHTKHLFEALPTTISTETRLVQSLPRYSGRFEGIKDCGIWGRTATQLRADGLVAWRPVNLLYGNAAAKADVVARYETESNVQTARLEPVNRYNGPPCSWRIQNALRLVRIWDKLDAELSITQLYKTDNNSVGMRTDRDDDASQLEILTVLDDY